MKSKKNHKKIRLSKSSKTKIEKEVLICLEEHLNHSTLTKTDECVAEKSCVAAVRATTKIIAIQIQITDHT